MHILLHLKLMNSTEEFADAVNYPTVRLMSVGHMASNHTLDDLARLDTHWSKPSKGKSKQIKIKLLLSRTEIDLSTQALWCLSFYYTKYLFHSVNIEESLSRPKDGSQNLKNYCIYCFYCLPFYFIYLSDFVSIEEVHVPIRY